MDRPKPDVGEAGGICSGPGELPRHPDGAASDESAEAGEKINREILEQYELNLAIEEATREREFDDMAATIPAPPKVPSESKPEVDEDDFARKFRDSDPAKRLRSAQSQTMARVSHFAQLVREKLGVTKIPSPGKLPKS